MSNQTNVEIEEMKKETEEENSQVHEVFKGILKSIKNTVPEKHHRFRHGMVTDFKKTEKEAMEEMECWHTDNHLGKCEKHKEEKEECWRCGEKDDPEFMISIPIGYICVTCGDDMGVTRSFGENE